MARDHRRTAKVALALFDRLAAPAIGVVAALALVGEASAPLRRRTATRKSRWPANAVLGAIAAVAARTVVVPAMIHTAARTQRRGGPLRSLATLALLDYSMYWWHRANHEVPFLWRFHAAHHIDPDVDVTTALRFHVVELLLSIPVRSAVVALLGVTPREVAIYECVMQTAATFHHTNVRLPGRLDAILASVIVTPTLHGTHHSDQDLASNWGVVLSLWDRLHGTRRAVAQDGVRIGVPAQPPISTATNPLRVLLLALRGASI